MPNQKTTYNITPANRENPKQSKRSVVKVVKTIRTATNRMWVFPNYGRHLPSGIKNGTE